jgi:hypothetical protein
MTATDLVAAVTPVVEALETLDVPYYLAGSIASSAHGIARASLDVDIGVLRVAATDRDYLRRWAVVLEVNDLLDRALEQATE